MNVKVEYFIILMFILGIFYGLFNLAYTDFFVYVATLFISIFVVFAPIIVFLVIFLSMSVLVVKGESIYNVGGRIVFYILLFSYVASFMGFLTYPLIIQQVRYASASLNPTQFASNIFHIFQEVIIRPIFISVLLGLLLPYTFKKVLHRFPKYFELGYNFVIRGFKSLTLIMPLISFSLGISLYSVLKTSLLELVVSAVTFIFLVGLLLISILPFLLGLYKFGFGRLFKYSINIFLSTLSVGASYLALPINIKIFHENFDADEISDVALTLGASMNRCGSIAGAIIAIYLSSIYTGVKISVLQALIVMLMLPVIALGSPGIHGGTLLVGMPIIIDILGISSTSPFLTTALSIFVGITTYIQAAINTTTNGYIALLLQTHKNTAF